MKELYIIKDWAGNELDYFGEFTSFEDAEDRLSIELGDDYDESRGEYYILERE